MFLNNLKLKKAETSFKLSFSMYLILIPFKSFFFKPRYPYFFCATFT